MTNPNLVPTVITDVNGKVTTVHKKLFETPTSPWSTPPPPGGWDKGPKKVTEPRIGAYSTMRMDNPIGTPEERAETLAAISEILGKSPFLSASVDTVMRCMSMCKDGDHLKRVQGALEAVKPENINSLVSRIRNYDDDALDAAYAYRDIVRDDYDNNLESLMELHINLVDRLSPEIDENGGIKNFGAHLYARDNTVLSDMHPRMGRYGASVTNEDYVALVDQYADSVVALVAYVSERGYDDFNHDDFEEYLSNGPVSGGWL